jgi:hypothetical protein
VSELGSMSDSEVAWGLGPRGRWRGGAREKGIGGELRKMEEERERVGGGEVQRVGSFVGIERTWECSG